MDSIFIYILLALVLWLGNYLFYLSFNHGLAPNARLQQLLRYLPASIVAVLPIAITGTDVMQPAVLKLIGITELWALAYPLTYHLTFRKSSPDYDHQIDPAFALYLFSIMSGLAILLPPYVMAIVYAVVIIIPMFVLGYYFIYRHVVDTNGILAILQTNYNEALEFFRAYSLWRTIAFAVGVVAVGTAFITGGYELVSAPVNVWMVAFIIVLMIAIGHYMFKPNRGIFARTGIINLYCEVKEYNRRNDLYAEQLKLRMQKLKADCMHPLPSPHTFLVVVGESASRDFMSAFTSMKEDTTPWLRELSMDKQHCFLFPNAYSCDIQTVPVLEKALTTFNQYDGGEFYTSTSFVNVARKLGYKVHWYSNQGYLGSADTPITLVAESADVAKWTNQQLGKKYYDGALIDFLTELDPTTNNLVVLHLMGSHFNYENRFPESFRQWKATDIHDKITNYKNTLYYTDHILNEAFSILSAKYNLQGMIYCSDHGDIPDRHRQPYFGGFKDTRIPLAVWLGDEYISKRPERAQALRDNVQKYWTNDLLCDLVCGIMDAECAEYKEENSLASMSYKHERDTLTIMNGTVHISNEETMEKGV